MAVCIRMKKFGRAHRHFFRICATDKRAPRDGKVLEELGTYDPMISDVDARASLNNERIDYWLSVGAQPSDKCAVLIKKYGTNGTHADQQRAAQERLAMPVDVPDPGEPAALPKKEEETAAEGGAEAKADEGEATKTDGGESATAEAPAEEPTAAEEPKEEQAEAKPEEAAEAKPEEEKAEAEKSE